MNVTTNNSVKNHLLQKPRVTVNDLVEWLQAQNRGNWTLTEANLLFDEPPVNRVNAPIFGTYRVSNVLPEDVEQENLFAFDYNGETRCGFVHELTRDSVLLHDLSVGGEWRRFKTNKMTNLLLLK